MRLRLVPQGWQVSFLVLILYYTDWFWYHAVSFLVAYNATKGTAIFLKEHGIRTRVKKKISEGSEEILDSMRKGYVNYVISTRDVDAIDQETDGSIIRRCAVENNIAMFTALDTVRVLLDVLEEITLCISTINE